MEGEKERERDVEMRELSTATGSISILTDAGETDD